MNYVERVFDGVHYVFNLNAATLSGAIDIIVVEQEDGTLKSTPFHVRFGKLQLLSSTEKTVTIQVNEEETDLKMKLGSAGEAFFVEETDQSDISPSQLTSPQVTSPIQSPPQSPSPIRSKMHSEELKAETLTSALEEVIKQQERKEKINEEKEEEESPSNGEVISNEAKTKKVPKVAPTKTESDGVLSNAPLTTEKNIAFWEWGTLPKVTEEPLSSTTLKKTESISEEEKLLTNSNEEKENSSTKSNNPPPSSSSSWTSMFRIFKGSDSQPDYLVKYESETEDEFDEEIAEITEKGTKTKSNLSGSRNVSSLDESQNSLKNSTETQEQFVLEEIQPSNNEPLGKRAPSLSLQELGELKIEMAKCANLMVEPLNINLDNHQIFNDHLITYEEFCEKPEIIFDPNVLFRIRDRLYSWSVAGPLIVSIIAFRKPLPFNTIEKMEQQFFARNQKRGWTNWFWRSRQSSSNVSNKPSFEEPVKKKVFVKSLRPTSDQLKALNLRPGANSIKYIVNSSLQGERSVCANIYLWNRDCKIVISDIDGTITKSDVMGHILPILGKDWSHSGVAQLYQNIKANGYNILYLTSRPIGSADLTKGYIKRLKQRDIELPQGPVFLSPNRLLTSFNQEVILRKPEEFKIECLKDIKSLFPKDSKPFYAGFGNRPTDAKSYQAVSVPLGKTFIINYKGEISILNDILKKTYNSLNDLVSDVFPSIVVKRVSSEEWNTWNYWKRPIIDLDEQ